MAITRIAAAAFGDDWFPKPQKSELPVTNPTEPQTLTNLSREQLLDRLTGDKISDVLNQVSNILLQQIVGSKTTKLKPALQTLQEKIQRRVWNIAQKWSDWGDTGPVMFPENTKLYYKKGNSAVVLIEQKPAVRSVVFDARLIQSNADELQRDFSFNLALPYIVFMFIFKKGILQNEHMFFLNEPLTDIGQVPLNPCLSNLQSENLQICWGKKNKPVVTEEDHYNYAKQANAAINQYWTSRFTGEWDSHYSIGKNLDVRLATPRKWEEYSRQDPLFPLSVSWKPSIFPTFRYAVSLAWENDEVIQSMQQELFKAIVDESLQDLESAFLEVPVELDLTAAKIALTKVVSDAIQ